MTIWICIQLLLLINYCTDISEGIINISSSPRTAVCNVGDELQITCNTTDDFLTWNVKFVAGNQITRTLSSTIRNSEVVRMNSATVTFSRMSELGSTSGLISKLVINTVSQSLNKTNITCMEVGLLAMKATTTVYIIGNASDYLNSPEVRVNSEVFGTDDVSVVLDMQVDNSLLNINISSSPEINSIIIAINTSSAHFTIPYNTPTNVSISANLCGMQNATVIELNYAKCDPPSASNGSGITVATRYSDLALEGTYITISCSQSGFLLHGPTVARCANNGQWNPDPRNVKCIANCGHPQPPTDGYILPYSSTAEGARVIFVCRNSSQTLHSPQYELEYSALCTPNRKWEPNPTDLCYRTSNKDNLNLVTIVAIASSVCSVLVISTLIISFIIGFTCGRCSNKTIHSGAKELHGRSLHQTMGYPNSVAVYECPDFLAERVKREPKLEENVAYTPLQYFQH